MSEPLAHGAVEPLECLALDAAGAPLTGLVNLKARVRREADGFLLDWADLTFKTPATVGTPLAALVEVDSTHCPGEYRKVLDTSAITNPTAGDTYVVTIVQDGAPQSAVNMPQQGELRTDHFFGDPWATALPDAYAVNSAGEIVGSQIKVAAATAALAAANAVIAAAAAETAAADALVQATLARKARTNREELLEGSVNNYTLYDDDNVTPLRVHSVTDKNGNSIVLPVGTPAHRSVKVP
jgi:hypothetical protein